MALLGWAFLIILGLILAIWLSREDEGTSRFERNAMSKVYASEIDRPKYKGKSKASKNKRKTS